MKSALLYVERTGQPEMRLLTPAQTVQAPRVLPFGLEFTCWDDSLQTGWSDPARPPEVIEVGIVSYDTTGGIVLGEFTSLVRPTLNNRLLDYSNSSGCGAACREGFAGNGEVVVQQQGGRNSDLLLGSQ